MLAGSFRGADFAGRYVHHAVCDGPVKEGRLKRDAGEAFCNRRINDVDGNLSDSGGWSDNVSEIDCPRCLEILHRLKASGVLG